MSAPRSILSRSSSILNSSRISKPPPSASFCCTLQFRNQVLQAIVAGPCAFSHSGCDDHVTYFPRWITHRRRQAGFAALFAELGSHYRDAVGKLLEDLR